MIQGVPIQFLLSQSVIIFTIPDPEKARQRGLKPCFVLLIYLHIDQPSRGSPWVAMNGARVLNYPDILMKINQSVRDTAWLT